MNKRSLAVLAAMTLIGGSGLTTAALAAPRPVASQTQAAAALPAPAEVTGEVVDQRAVLRWAPVAGARDYLVLDVTRSGAGRSVGSTSGTSWTSPRLPLSTPAYSFVVVARDSAKKQGVRSEPVRVFPGGQPATPSTPPAEPATPTEPATPPTEPTEPTTTPTDPTTPTTGTTPTTEPTTATPTEPTTPPVAEPDGSVPAPTRVWSYEDAAGLLPDPWDEVHALRSDTQGLTTDNPYPGSSRTAFFSVRPGDTGWNGTKGTLRSEVRDSIADSGEVQPGDEQYWAWSTFFPASFDWDERGQFLIFTQWHQTVNSGNPNVHFWSDVDEKLMVDVRGGAGGRVAGDAQYVETFELGSIDKGAWNDLTVRFVWSPDPATGLIEVWHQGEKVLSENAANLYDGQSVYIKQGIYSAAGTAATHYLQHAPIGFGPTLESVAPLNALHRPAG
ncbi:heparin lyase I family protein [Blastococcus xanthinilyticus]|uniref:Polysaccharide lyase-like protein n=1 Tax=Blastococcus xanthinilyticus TaxID=1564164 RepID=A0A5S5CXS7_9ACTN|nr:heparin lyase I family protein [Blastococcus xanthinilyticus]TYP87169.1 polysaccharide lyase-like protein [Blastococcus xanthinilyticus]